MSLTFDGLSIPGIVQPWSADPWDIANQVHSLFGVEGEGHLYGGRTGRTLVIPVWVYDGYANYALLTTKLRAIEAKIGRTGTVAETSGVSVTYSLCKLLSMSLDKEGPLPPNAHIGWSQRLTLTFRQLRP